jgi:hypothetical protein
VCVCVCVCVLAALRLEYALLEGQDWFGYSM